MASLEITDLTVRLGDPKRTVLEKVSFLCDGGNILLILGANGSGKSVLLRTLLGLHQVKRGSVLLDGSPLAHKKDGLYRRSGVALQNPDHQIFGDTVFDDLCIGRTPDDVRRHPAVAAFGLDALLNVPPHELSGGQRRRLALAGACIASRDFLFLDEPFIELDYPHILVLIDQIRYARSRGSVVVVASHETRDIWEISDRVLLLHDGRPVVYGPPDTVRPYVSPRYGLRPLESSVRT